jgi:hypothetical protein
MKTISLTLPYRLPLWNQIMRMHWAKRQQTLRLVAWHVLAAMVKECVSRPSVPIQRARVTVRRHSPKVPDKDGLNAKHLLDVLQPLSKRHPCGLGIIAGDDPDHLESSIEHFHSYEKRTDVLIEEL